MLIIGKMSRSTILSAIIVLILIILAVFIGQEIASPASEANPSASAPAVPFRGPSGAPHAKGPGGPPPTSAKNASST